MPSVSVHDLPNLPGIRRDISTANPKLYREFKASQGQPFGSIDEGSRMTSANPASNNYTPVSTPFTPVDGDVSHFEFLLYLHVTSLSHFCVLQPH